MGVCEREREKERESRRGGGPNRSTQECDATLIFTPKTRVDGVILIDFKRLSIAKIAKNLFQALACLT